MDVFDSAARELLDFRNGTIDEAGKASEDAKPVQATVSNVTADGVYVKTDGDDTAKGPFPATIMPKLNDRVALTNLGGTWTVTDDFDDPGASGTWVNTETGKITQRVDEIRAGVGKFDELYATTATFSVLVAENATLEQLQAAQVYAESVNAQLVAAPVAQFGEIYAESATVQDITANVARIDTAELKQLNADVATFGVIDAKFARIDAANIDTATMREAWVDSLMVQTGLISHSGTIYELDAIQVNASKIKAGTLDVERLIVTVNNEKYLVHVDAQGTAAYQKLDGNIVEDLTITTDKLVAGAVTAQKITTENIVGTGGWINLRNGTFSYVNATSGQGISWDGTTLTVNGNVTVGGSTMSLSDVASMAADAEASKVWEGTCSTAADTSEKAVTCTGLTALEDGTTILVVFSNASAVNYPTLNVNALGAMDIKVGGSVASNSNNLHWGAGAAIRFRCEGSYWVVDTPPAKFYAFCTTAAATTTKIAVPSTSRQRVVMQKDTEVTVDFTYAHTGYIGACLSIIGIETNAQLIISGGGIVIGSNGNSWKAGQTITFVFSGSSWRVVDSSARKEAAEAATMATNYVTDITGGGVMVHPSDDSTSGWKIAGAIELLKSGVSQIWAGIESSVAVMRVGLQAAANIVLSGNGYIELRQANSSIMHVGSDNSDNHKLLTFGSRNSSYNIGDYSASFGNNNAAEGEYSMAVGNGAKTGFGCAFASGYNTYAGAYCHAEGYGSEAGDTSTLGTRWAAHAEGRDTVARDYASHAEGIGTKAMSNYQHVQGKYNVEDANGTYAHIVGNGSSSSARSNAHTLDWNGNAWFAGGVTGSSISDGTGTLAQLRESVSSTQGVYRVAGRIPVIRYTHSDYTLELHLEASSLVLYKIVGSTVTSKVVATL